MKSAWLMFILTIGLFASDTLPSQASNEVILPSSLKHYQYWIDVAFTYW